MSEKKRTVFVRYPYRDGRDRFVTIENVWTTTSNETIFTVRCLGGETWRIPWSSADYIREEES